MKTLNTVRQIALAAFLSIPQLAMADTPRLDFRPEATRTAGPVTDGTLLGRGRVSWDGPHAGFHLWLEGGQESLERRLALSPPGGKGSPLRVRLETDEPVTADKAGRGIVILSSDNSVSFSIVIDGNQEASPGVWNMRISAATLLGQ